MAARAKTAGVLGAVVDGRIRDLEEHWELGAKVWARGTGIMGAGAGGLEVREVSDSLLALFVWNGMGRRDTNTDDANWHLRLEKP